MWKTKKFDNESTARQWMKDHEHLYVMEFVFGNNCCYVEYKFLYKI